MCYEIWKEYVDTKSSVLRDRLIVHYMFMAKIVAFNLAKNLPSVVDVNDLISYGVIGLIKAIESFDPGKGFKFTTFSSFRIKGAILDELRKFDWVPRSTRQKFKSFKHVQTALEYKFKRLPYDQEMRDALKLDEKQYRDLLLEITPIVVISLDETFYNMNGNSLPFQPVSKDNIVDYLNNKQVWAVIKKTVDSLSEIEKKIFDLYNFKNFTMFEIGSMFKLSESRVSQIHSKIILKLRLKLKSVSIEEY
jgi:RNA polymerase sigma factor for flagellar operon FliA